MRVQPQATQKWHGGQHVLRYQKRKQPHSLLRQHETESSADECQQQSFRNELHHEPSRRCAESPAYRHLALTAFCTDQQQAGYVDACDQQENSGATQYCQQNRANVAYDDVREWQHECFLITVRVRIQLLKIFRYGFDVGEGCCEGHTLLEPCYTEKRMAATTGIAGL